MKKIRLAILAICIWSITFLQAMTNEEFFGWWQSYRNTPQIPKELREMEEYFINAGLLKHSSQFWNWLNHYNIQQIALYGYENFKQTVTRNYFTWVVSIDHPYAINLKHLVPRLEIKLPVEEINRIHPFFGVEDSFRYNVITEYFLNYIVQIGGLPFLEQLEEPFIGNPPFSLYNGKRLSQDIFNSLLEYIPISKHCKVNELSTVIEIGAGSGRTAFCFLSLLPSIKYVIVDFPPALYVSQTYLCDVFPMKKVMKFRPFKTFEEIAKEYTEADLVFLTPDQLSKLPDHSGDLFLAIDCLHEMKLESINEYFLQANRLCSFIYFKCWQHTVVPYDEITHTSDSYPVYSNWIPLFRETCPIPSGFFHAFYKIK